MLAAVISMKRKLDFLSRSHEAALFIFSKTLLLFQLFMENLLLNKSSICVESACDVKPPYMVILFIMQFRWAIGLIRNNSMVVLPIGGMLSSVYKWGCNSRHNVLQCGMFAN